MSSDKSKYSIYLLDKKTPSYSGSSKSPISFAKMFIKNCNLKNKSITFYVKNCKNKKLYGPYLGNLDKKTVKLQKNKQKGGMEINVTYYQHFLNPDALSRNCCFTIKINTIHEKAPVLISFECNKNPYNNGFNFSSGIFRNESPLDHILYYYQTYALKDLRDSFGKFIIENNRNFDVLLDQVTLNNLEKTNPGKYPYINQDLLKLYQNKGLRTIYDKLCKICFDRYLSTVSQFITSSSFALLPKNLDAMYKISFSILGRNPHIFFNTMRHKSDEDSLMSRKITSTPITSTPNVDFFRYLLYKNRYGNVMFAQLLVSGSYPNFTYEVDGYYDPTTNTHILSQENLVIIRDAILEYRRVYYDRNFATTIYNYVMLKLSQTSS